jgi:hypothetical protein
VQAINADGKDREGAWVDELTEHLDLSAWPERSGLTGASARTPAAQF